jgi:hypothetical protein
METTGATGIPKAAAAAIATRRAAGARAGPDGAGVARARPLVESLDP